jgi:hypothetical protein
LAIHSGATLLLIAPLAIKTLFGSAARNVAWPTPIKQMVKQIIPTLFLISRLLPLAYLITLSARISILDFGLRGRF